MLKEEWLLKKRIELQRKLTKEARRLGFIGSTDNVTASVTLRFVGGSPAGIPRARRATTKTDKKITASEWTELRNLSWGGGQRKVILYYWQTGNGPCSYEELSTLACTDVSYSWIQTFNLVMSRHGQFFRLLCVEENLKPQDRKAHFRIFAVTSKGRQ